MILFSEVGPTFSYSFEPHATITAAFKSIMIPSYEDEYYENTIVVFYKETIDLTTSSEIVFAFNYDGIIFHQTRQRDKRITTLATSLRLNEY